MAAPQTRKLENKITKNIRYDVTKLTYNIQKLEQTN
jgi:hypothetical protein